LMISEGFFWLAEGESSTSTVFADL